MTAQIRTAKRDPEGNRSALIKATLDSIAEVGIVETTVSEIIERAQLSRGMIHLHFGGKSQLLSAAAEAFSEEYYTEVDRHIQLAGTTPEAIIMAVVSADLSETALNERSSKILHAFRGEAGTHTGIAQLSSTRDKRLRNIIRNAFEVLSKGHCSDGTSTLARDATFGLLAMLEGMWADYLSNPNEFSRDVAASIVCRFLAGIFPNHFQNQARLASV